MNRRAVVFAIASLGLLPLRNADAQASNPGLHRVNKIYIATLGSSAGAERFRSLLEDALRNVGFEISSSTADADAIFNGEFATEAHGDYAMARFTADLKPTKGKQTLLWSGDNVTQHRGTSRQDVVKATADTCAEQLRKSWEKSGN
ncbi:hypothetical protein P8935_11670 [Telmatobacter sp. DSM 110680]|uniref:Uncharacterized protein n=1 Tax=Telmatobacter sp. DSM 110680 TaxID=3036704 RepID=A0AAU7DSE7_9BACT